MCWLSVSRSLFDESAEESMEEEMHSSKVGGICAQKLVWLSDLSILIRYPHYRNFFCMAQSVCFSINILRPFTTGDANFERKIDTD